jgi:hypothetical protein
MFVILFALVAVIVLVIFYIMFNAKNKDVGNKPGK